MPDVLALSADFTLDVQLTMDEVTAGSVMRAENASRVARSTSIDVARLLRGLGHDVHIGGALAGTNGKFIEHQLTSEGILGQYAWCEGETPQRLVVTERTARTTTVNEQPLAIESAYFEQLASQIREISSHFAWIAVAGTTLPGTVLQSILEVVHPARVAVVGDVLMEVPEDRVDLLVLNAGQASRLLGQAIVSMDDAHRACQELCSRDIPCVIISLKDEGIVGCNQQICWHAIYPHTSELNSSRLLAGALDALLSDEPLENVLCRGIAASQKFASLVDYRHLISEVVLKQIG